MLKTTFPDAVKIGMLCIRRPWSSGGRPYSSGNRKISSGPGDVIRKMAVLWWKLTINTLIEKRCFAGDFDYTQYQEAEKSRHENYHIGWDSRNKPPANLWREETEPRFLVKGAIRLEDATDLLFAGKELVYIRAPQLILKNTHGTGCTLSSAIYCPVNWGESAL